MKLFPFCPEKWIVCNNGKSLGQTFVDNKRRVNNRNFIASTITLGTQMLKSLETTLTFCAQDAYNLVSNDTYSDQNKVCSIEIT